MSKSSAAIYAQTRRDNETAVREALKTLIPEEYFTKDLMENGEYNLSTKVFLGAKAYICDSRPDGKEKTKDEHQVEPPRDTEMKPFPIHLIHAHRIISEETIFQLRQVATRLVQKAVEKVEANGGLSEELKAAIDTASDSVIDCIEGIEKVR